MAAQGLRSTRVSSREATLDTLRRRIISLELAPGASLSENELSAELGVSRTPVRESLIVLREEGLVQVFPQVGTFVSLVDPERVAHAQFLREAIECASLAAVGYPVDPAGLLILRENLEAQDATARDADAERFFELDEQFHRELLVVGGHESAWATVTRAKAHLDRARRLSLIDTRPIAGLVEQHRAVVDALESGEVGAAVERLRTHLRAVFDDVEVIRTNRPELFGDDDAARPQRRTVRSLSS